MYLHYRPMFVTIMCCLATVTGASAKQDPITSDKNINCGACKGLFDELDYLISKVPEYRKIDLGNQRMDPNGNMPQKMKAYARSEVHLTELLDEVCAEMKNYSGFTEDDGRTIYHRYQNRPEEKTPLKLGKFGWSLETQGKLRLACDMISAEFDEEIIESYMTEKEIEYKKDLCGRYCKKANMDYLLYPWYGLDEEGNPLAEGETEYVDGRVNAEALAIKNKKELEAKRKQDKLDKKRERQEKKKKLREEKKAKKAAEFASAMKEDL